MGQSATFCWWRIPLKKIRREMNTQRFSLKLFKKGPNLKCCLSISLHPCCLAHQVVPAVSFFAQVSSILCLVKKTRPALVLPEYETQVECY